MSNEESFSSASQDGTKANSVVVKIALIGDAAIGKTSLMVKYVEDKFDEDYIQTLGTSRFLVEHSVMHLFQAVVP